MATISEKLQLALDNKAKIKAAIEEKGGTITGDMSTWGESIKGLKGGGGDIFGDLPAKCAVYFDKESGAPDIAYYFGSNNMSAVAAIEFKGITHLRNIITEYDFPNIKDISIDYFTWSTNYEIAPGIDNNIKSSIINLAKGAVQKGNLRLEGTWDELPDELLDAYIGWELYINGEYIGTITPKSEGGYYYAKELHDFYAGDGYNGSFVFQGGSGNDYLQFYDGVPEQLKSYDYNDNKVLSNRGEEYISRISEKSIYVGKNEGRIEWIDIV